MAADLTVYLDGAKNQIFNIASAGATEKMVEDLAAEVGELQNLHTTDTSSIVAAINELVRVKANGTGLTFSVVNGILTVTY